MAQAIKPKPGIYKGVRYRSQLEISWAKWFDEHCPGEWLVSYSDCHDHDFVTGHYKHFNDSRYPKFYMEIKPLVSELVEQALNRIDMSTKRPGDHWMLLIGNPPSPYGNTFVVDVHFITTSHIYGPVSELSLCINCGPLVSELWPLCVYSSHSFDSCILPCSLWEEYKDGFGGVVDNCLLKDIVRGIGCEGNFSDEW